MAFDYVAHESFGIGEAQESEELVRLNVRLNRNNNV